MENRYCIEWKFGSKVEDTSQADVKEKVELPRVSSIVASKSMAIALRAKKSTGQRAYVDDTLPKFTPRTIFNAKRLYLQKIFLRVLLSLDSNDLDKLKVEFECHEHGELSLKEFVEMIFSKTKALNFNYEVEHVVQALVELFDSLDLDGNDSLSFPELLETIIHWGLTAGGSGAGTKMVLDDPIPVFVQGIRKRLSKRVTKRRIQYIEVLDRILVHEVLRKKIVLLDPDTFKTIKRADIGRNDITHIEYIHQDSQGRQCKLLVACSSRFIHVYEGLGMGRFNLKLELPTRSEGCCAKHILGGDLLIVGARNGDIYAWDLANDFAQREPLKGHTRAVVCMATIPGTQQIITGSLDFTLCMWDLEYWTRRYVYSGHTDAVTCVAYSKDLNLFVSGSLDSTICVWSVRDSHVLNRLTGHKRPIIFLTFEENSPQCISADESGVIKIWDTRISFACVQTIVCDVPLDTMALCVKRESRLVFTTLNDIHAYDQPSIELAKKRKKRMKDTAHDWLVSASYNPNTLVFSTATGRKVRFWNALTGCLQAEFANIMPGDICHMCFDHNERKMILGSSLGDIQVFNAMSGGYMKHMESHRGEILGLQYLKEYRMVVSLGSDGLVKIHDEKPIHDCPTVCRIQLRAKRIVEPCVFNCSYELSLVAVADLSGKIGVWDLETGFPLDTYDGHQTAVLSIQFLKDWPLIISSDDEGNVHAWLTRPSAYHGQKVFSFVHRAETTGNRCSVNAFTYDDERSVLYGGDNDGWIHGWDISALLEKVCPDGRINIGLHPDRPRVISFREQQSDAIKKVKLNKASTLPDTTGMTLLRRFSFPCTDLFIARIGFIKDPQSLWVKTWGPRLTIWSPHGEKLGDVGILAHARLKNQMHAWKFRVDTEMQERNDRETAKSLLINLDGKVKHLVHQAEEHALSKTTETEDYDVDEAEDKKLRENPARLIRSSLSNLPHSFHDAVDSRLSQPGGLLLSHERAKLRHSESHAILRVKTGKQGRTIPPSASEAIVGVKANVFPSFDTSQLKRAKSTLSLHQKTPLNSFIDSELCEKLKSSSRSPEKKNRKQYHQLIKKGERLNRALAIAQQNQRRRSAMINNHALRAAEPFI